MRAWFTGKLWALALVLGALMLGLSMVRAVVQEREARRDEAQRSLANSLAQAQTLLGPVLVRSCTETWAEDTGRREKNDDTERTLVRWHKKAHTLRLPAQTLSLNGQLQAQSRHRGLYRLNGYQAKATVQAQWPSLDGLAPPAGAEASQSTVSCQAPRLAFALSDARGIRAVQLKVNGQTLAVQPGSTLDATPQGFHVMLPHDLTHAPSDEALARLNIELELEWMGTASLSIAPVAEQLDVSWRSNWAHPSFGGHFLPSEREIGPQGFTARWRLSALSSTAASEWKRGQPLCALPAPSPEAASARDVDQPSAAAGGGASNGCVESFGVTLLDPVNPYVLSDRATKYGLLFIVLTFVGVGLVEVLRRLRVHPVQYLLVGAALAIFFLLLLSLSEHVAFGLAYSIAGAACTLLLAVYGSFVLGGWRAGAAFGAALATLYGALYAVLQMEQTALLLGTLMLFAALAVVMLSTRHLDWYALQAGEVQPARRASSDGGAAP